MKRAWSYQAGIVFVCVVACIFVLRFTILYRPNSGFLEYQSNSNKDRTARPKECSMDTIRQFVADHHALPGSVRWTNVENATYPKSQFTLSECYYPRLQIRANYVAECMRKKKASRVAILGDSTGLLYYRALLAIMNTHESIKCETIRYEKRNGKTPDKQYYADIRTNSTDVIFTHPFDCSGCNSRMEKCAQVHGKQSSDILLEYVAMEYAMDKEITTHR